jgi:hypothetical protein
LKKETGAIEPPVFCCAVPQRHIFRIHCTSILKAARYGERQSSGIEFPVVRRIVDVEVAGRRDDARVLDCRLGLMHIKRTARPGTP